MKKNLCLLTTAEEIAELANILKEEKIIGFDTEFIRESTFFPMIELIQVSTSSESWLIDAKGFKKNFEAMDPHAFDPGIQPLLSLLKDPSILKIAHASQADQECLYTSFGTVALPCLDTSIAASLCGYGESIGLAKLLKDVLSVHISKGYARANWSTRPLQKYLLEYAHTDVEFLIPLGLELMHQLEKMQRKEWALVLSARTADVRQYQLDVEAMTQKISRRGRLSSQGYLILRELVSWREKRIRKLNSPRKWIADDQILLDWAQTCPKTLEHLSTFRGVSKVELKNSGDVILEIIKQGVEKKAELFVPPVCNESLPLKGSQVSVLELLRCFVNILADRHHIASKYLITANELVALTKGMENNENLETFPEQFLNEYTAILIGPELVSFLKGERALFLRNNRVEMIDLNKVLISHRGGNIENE